MIRKLVASTLLATGLCVASTAAATPPDRSAAEAAVESLDGRAVWSDFRNAPALVTGLRIAPEGETQQERAEAFLAEWSERLLGLSVSDLVFAGTEGARDRTSIRYQQFHQGLPVTGRFVLVTLNDAGEVLSVSNDTVGIAQVEAGGLAEVNARAIAFAAVHPEVPASEMGLDVSAGTPTVAELPSSVADTTKAMRVILADAGRAMVVWKVHVMSHPVMRNATVLVDTQTGKVVGLKSNVQH